MEDLKTLKAVLSDSYKDLSFSVPLSNVVKQVREEVPFTCTFLDIAGIALKEKDPETLNILEKKESIMPSIVSQNS